MTKNDEMDMDKLIDAIKTYQQQTGKTSTEFAAWLGVSAAYLYSAYTRRRPPDTLITALLRKKPELSDGIADLLLAFSGNLSA